MALAWDPGVVGRGVACSLWGRQSASPAVPPQHGGFRKQQDLDNILEWKPSEVSPRGVPGHCCLNSCPPRPAARVRDLAWGLLESGPHPVSRWSSGTDAGGLCGYDYEELPRVVDIARRPWTPGASSISLQAGADQRHIRGLRAAFTQCDCRVRGKVCGRAEARGGSRLSKSWHQGPRGGTRSSWPPAHWALLLLPSRTSILTRGV